MIAIYNALFQERIMLGNGIFERWSGYSNFSEVIFGKVIIKV